MVTCPRGRHTAGGGRLSGYLPILERSGYRGPVYCTPPTRDLLEILLPESGRIQEEDAGYLPRKGLSRHSPARPLYTEADARQALERLERTLDRGGIPLVPSFALGRTQNLLYYLHEIFRRREAPCVPVHVNSPMATDVTRIYRRRHAYHRRDERACAAMCDVASYVRSVEESRRLNASRRPCVIISASGMATGGRVLHHLRALLPQARHTVLRPGYQAPGTRGAALAAGTESVEIHGRYVPVRAEVVPLAMFSAHADQHDLVAWLASAPAPPRRLFVVHGEPGAADALRVRARGRLGCDVSVPGHLDTVTLR